MKEFYTCEDIKKNWGKYGPVCCSSCHAEMYNDDWFELQSIVRDKQKYYVCCRIAKIINEIDQEEPIKEEK